MIVPVDRRPSIASRPPYHSTAIRPSCGIRLKTGTNFARRSDRPHRRFVHAVGVDRELVDLLLLLAEALHHADADDRLLDDGREVAEALLHVPDDRVERVREAVGVPGEDRRRREEDRRELPATART